MTSPNVFGIIPAYAGRTGEGSVAGRLRVGGSGSSPHTRGAQLSAPCAMPVPPDHPRIRGEHPIAAKPDNLVMGSSPHTRGAPKRISPVELRWRIIPAYAGSTAASRPLAARVADHPRIRGEHDGAEIVVVEDLRIIPAYAGSTCR